MRRFFTSGWLGLHALALTLCGTFLFFGWWQFERAMEGNARSWAYTFEWPIFAVFVIVMWVKMIRDTLDDDGETKTDRTRRAPAAPAVPAETAEVIRRHEEEDPELAAYNRYLARLSAQSHRRG